MESEAEHLEERNELTSRTGMFFGTPHIGPDFGGPLKRPYRPFQDPAAATNLGAMFDAVARRRGAAIVAEDETGAISFADLRLRINALAGVVTGGPPGPVGIVLGCDIYYLAAVFACLIAGRMSVLLDEGAPAARSVELLAEAGAAIVLARAHINDDLGSVGCAKIDLDDALSSGADETGRPFEGLGLDAPAFVLCTSGSTGKPKLIAHSQRTMFHWARTTHNALHVDESDRTLSLSPFSTLGGFTALLSYPLAGAALQIMDVRRAGVSGLLEALRVRPVTILRAAPSLLRAVCKAPGAKTAFAGLRVVQTYGEPLTGTDVDAVCAVTPPSCFLRTTYGSTEASGLSWFVDRTRTLQGEMIPGGVLMPDTEAVLIAENGGACGVNEPGELVIRSRYNALGEWTRDGLAVGRLPADPISPELRSFATGDLARVDANGVFVILGRIDRMLKLNGLRVEPAEVEAALRRHPAVTRAEVLVDRQSKPPRMVGFVVSAHGAPLNLEAALKQSLRGQLPAYMVPSRIMIVDDIPLLPGGKVDQVSLIAGAQTPPLRSPLRTER